MKINKSMFMKWIEINDIGILPKQCSRLVSKASIKFVNLALELKIEPRKSSKVE